LARPDQTRPVDRHDLAVITALRRSDPFTITKDSALKPAVTAAATSLAVHGAERGRGGAIIIFARASRLFKQPSAITICCGCSKRAEIQRQRGIQEEMDHVYSNDTSNDAQSPLMRQLKSNAERNSIASLMTKEKRSCFVQLPFTSAALIQQLSADVKRQTNTAPVKSGVTVTQVAQGCGPGRWRGPGGWCRGPGYGGRCWRGAYGRLHCA
jgi:hypothetical protein